MRKILIVCLVVLLSSCSKSFLDRDSLTALAEGSFWKSESDAVLGINAIYDVLQDRNLYSGSLNISAGLPVYDCLGDNCFNGYKWEGPGNYMEANVDPSAGFFSFGWNATYRGIARANTAIENIEKIPSSAISASKKNELIAQARFLRALFYTHLAYYYQDAPLITKVQTLSEAYVNSNPYSEIAAQIVTDLQFAATNLPATYPATQYGYATKGAALGILARFQLYNKNYQAVLDATTEIMSLGYSLNTDYAQLFTEAGENSREILFSVRFNQDVSANNELFSSTFLQAPKIDVQPMKNMVNEYYCTDGKPITNSPLYNPGTAANNAPQKLNRDPRLAASVYFRGDIFLTNPTNVTFNSNTATTYGLRKYIRRGASAAGIAVFNPGGQDFIVIRYADVLLMRAEAMIELNQLSGAYPLINQVRARVSMPSIETVEGTNLSKLALTDILRHERRVELAFEGLRFMDLKRWGTVQEAFQRAAGDAVPSYLPTYRGLKSETFAIPLSDLNANNALKQNAWWQ